MTRDFQVFEVYLDRAKRPPLWVMSSKTDEQSWLVPPADEHDDAPDHETGNGEHAEPEASGKQRGRGDSGRGLGGKHCVALVQRRRARNTHELNDTATGKTLPELGRSVCRTKPPDEEGYRTGSGDKPEPVRSSRGRGVLHPSHRDAQAGRERGKKEPDARQQGEAWLE